MNRNNIILGASALVLMALCAGLLVRLKANQHLGAPGLKVEPIAGADPVKVKVLLPERMLDYESREIAPTEAELAILPKDTSFGRRIYRSADGFEVQTSVVLMGTDRTSIHKPDFCLGGAGLVIDKREMAVVPMALPHPYLLPVQKFTCTRRLRAKDGRELTVSGLYVFWFVADGAVTASHLDRMLGIGRELLSTGTLQRWAYVSYFALAPVGREAEAWERMKAVIADSVPRFQTATAKSRLPVPATASNLGAPKQP